jgi:hypothetical protein
MAWKKGETGNAKGRPKNGNSLAEAIRRTVDPDEVVRKLMKIAEDSPSDQTKLRALEILLERGYKKPAQVLEVGPADPFEDMTDEELALRTAEIKARLAERTASEALGDVCTTRRGLAGDILDVDAVEQSAEGVSVAARPSPDADIAESRTTALVARGVLRRRPAASDEDTGT